MIFCNQISHLSTLVPEVFLEIFLRERRFSEAHSLKGKRTKKEEKTLPLDYQPGE